MVSSELLPLKILVVTAQPSSGQFLLDVLQEAGFQCVTVVESLPLAEESIHTWCPDLLVLDWELDWAAGGASLRRLRALLRDEYLPVLVITPDNTLETCRHAVREGASDVLSQPLNPIEVELRACNLLRARWQQAQLQTRTERLNLEVQAHREISDTLSATTARLSALLKDLQSGVLVEDEHRRIALVNPRFCELFGIPAPPEALKGGDCARAAEQSKQFFADPAGFVRRVEVILAARELVVNEELLLADGRVFERDYVPIYQDERYLGHLWSYRDISERKRDEEELRQSEARKAASLQTALDCIVTIDVQGTIQEWNAAAERTFGYKREEIVGEPIHLIVPPELREAHLAGVQRQATTGEVRILGKRVEVPALHKDGHEFPIEIAVARIETPRGPQYTAYMRDISERKRFEQELAKARDAALESARLKAEFLANMSHEIRTPINGVIGMLELLAVTPLESDQETLLQTANASAEALLGIINEVLDFSKIEAGKLNIEDGVYAPASVVEESLMMMAGAAQEKGLEIVAALEDGVPALVRGDGFRVRQVLANFLSNAVKFTSSGEIVVSVARELPLTLRFTVADTGVGVPPEVAQRLFQPFMQADGSTTRRYGGTGLGLAISRQLVELMNGEIGVESAPGQGAKFWFTLPLRPAPQEAAAPEKRVPQALTQAQILVVEDSHVSRTQLLRQLASWQIAASGVADARTALRDLRAAAARRPFDAILLDAQLPDYEAEFLLRNIAADQALSGLRVLLMTALNAPGAPEGVAASLSKPVRPSLLFDALVETFRESTAPAPQATQTTPEAAEGDAALRGVGVRVLVADDNAINREVVLRWLQKWGCETHPVTNGREALDAMRSGCFDLVLMDCQMPEMDGYEATAAIRRLPAPCCDVPIIAVTAHALEGDRQKCLDAGMNDYLPKPVRPALLAQTVARWQKSAARQEAPDTEKAPCPAVLDEETIAELRSLMEPEELRNLVENFAAQAAAQLQSLSDALQTLNAPQAAQCAHSIKGMARQLGAEHMASVAQNVEVAARHGDFPAARRACAALPAVFQQATAALEQAAALGVA